MTVVGVVGIMVVKTVTVLARGSNNSSGVRGHYGSGGGVTDTSGGGVTDSSGSEVTDSSGSGGGKNILVVVEEILMAAVLEVMMRVAVTVSQ